MYQFNRLVRSINIMTEEAYAEDYYDDHFEDDINASRTNTPPKYEQAMERTQSERPNGTQLQKYKNILEKSFAESRRNLGTSSVPPPRRVKTTNLNKSSNYHNLSRYETRTSRLETNRTTPIAQTYVTKKATIIQEIEEYLDKTMQKSFTQTINRKVDQKGNQVNKLSLENKMMRKEFQTINSKMNLLFEHINVSDVQSQFKLTQSTDRSLSAMRMKLWESEATNYDKITHNLENEYYRLDKRLTILADSGYKLGIERRIMGLDKRIEKHKQNRKIIATKHIKKEHLFKKLLAGIENGTVPKELNELGNCLELMRDKLEKTNSELEKSDIIVQEKTTECDKLEEKWEKLIIIAKKYGVSVEDVTRSNRAHKGRKLDRKCIDTEKKIERIISYNKNLRGKLEIFQKDFGHTYRDLRSTEHFLTTQLRNKENELYAKRQELAVLIERCKETDNVYISAILNKWEMQESGVNTNRYSSTNKYTSETTHTSNSQYQRIIEDRIVYERRMVSFIQCWFRMWLHIHKNKQAASKTNPIVPHSPPSTEQNGTSKPQFKRKQGKIRYPSKTNNSTIIENSLEETENRDKDSGEIQNAKAGGKGKQKLTAEEQAILDRYKRPVELDKETELNKEVGKYPDPFAKYDAYDPKSKYVEGNPELNKSKTRKKYNSYDNHQEALDMEDKELERTHVIINENYFYLEISQKRRSGEGQSSATKRTEKIS